MARRAFTNRKYAAQGAYETCRDGRSRHDIRTEQPEDSFPVSTLRPPNCRLYDIDGSPPSPMRPIRQIA